MKANPLIYFAILVSAYIIVIIVITLFYIKHKNKAIKEEIKKTFAELENDELNKTENKEKTDIESLLEVMQEDLENKEDEITSFEEDQEENAIISYQELLKAANKNKQNEIKENNNQIKIDNDIKSPNSKFENIDIKEEKEYENIPKTHEVNTEDVISNYKNNLENTKENKFRKTDFISPVYGKQNVDIKYSTVNKKEPVEIKRTEKIKKEESNDEFLNALKKLRQNL